MNTQNELIVYMVRSDNIIEAIKYTLDYFIILSNEPTSDENNKQIDMLKTIIEIFNKATFDQNKIDENKKWSEFNIFKGYALKKYSTFNNISNISKDEIVNFINNIINNIENIEPVDFRSLLEDIKVFTICMNDNFSTATNLDFKISILRIIFRK